MEFSKNILDAINKGFIEIDIEKDKIIYKNLKNGDKKYKFSNPEEQVRLEWYLDLVTKYQYEPTNIDLEVEMPKRVPNQFADLVIYEYGVDNKYFVIEFKKANITDNEFEQSVKQGIGNGRILKAKYYGTIAGETVRFFEEAKDDSLDDAFYSIPVKYGKPEEWTFIKGGIIDLEPVTSESLETVLGKAHQTIWDGGKRDKSRAFGEVAKIIFIKMWDEHKARRNGEAYEFQRKRNESVEKLALRIHAIYDEAKQRDKHVFAEDIKLNDKELAVVVEHLQRLSLTKTDLDVKGEAFQKFLGSFFKGDFGSYFTPSYVSKFCIDLFGDDIQNHDTILDPACGSGGFLLKTLDLVRQKADEYYEKNSSEHYKYWHDFAVNKLYGIEISEDTARIAKMNMILHEDGHTNVIGHDALDKIEKMQLLNLGFKKDGFDYIFTNPPFGADVKSTIKDYLGDYELSKNGSKQKKSQSTEILFIERCWQFLKPNGKIVIVLPDGLLVNSSLKNIREWILEHFKILGVISLTEDAFKFYGANVKSSILVLQKWGNKKEIDYKYFIATVNNIGITASGKKCENELPKIADQFRKFLNNNNIYDNLIEKEIKKELSEIQDFNIFSLSISELSGTKRFDPKGYSIKAKKILNNLKNTKYEVFKLKDIITDTISGERGEEIYKENYIKMKVLRNTNFSNNKNIDFSDVAERYIDIKKLSKGIELKKGDILIEKSGGSPIQPVGRVSIFNTNEGNYTFSNFLHCIRVNEKIVVPGYVFCFLRGLYKAGFMEYIQNQTTGIRNLIMEDFLEILIPIPSMNEQIEISNNFFDKINKVEKLENEIIELYKNSVQDVSNIIF